MSNILLDNIKFQVDIDNLLKRLHMDRDSDDFFTIQQFVHEAESVAKPKVLLRTSYIESRGEDYVVIDDSKCASRVLSVNLQNVNRVFPYIATCGMELYNWANSITDMVERFWADSICEAALHSAVQCIPPYLNEQYKTSKLSAMNPGSLKDWPLREQRSLFKLFGNPEELIGVKLTESCLMIPVKSVSGILFETEANYENCQLCPKENCPNRRAPYEKELFDNKYKI
jgi:hypothetical protein